jgi:hypothetical protein
MMSGTVIDDVNASDRKIINGILVSGLLARK